MNRVLLPLVLVALLLTACKKDPVYHGMPDVDVRDGVIVVRNTTDEPITSLGGMIVKHAGIYYECRNIVAYVAPGDSIIVSLSDFTGKDPSKPYGQRTVRFPEGETPESLSSVGKFLDGQGCPVSWPEKIE